MLNDSFILVRFGLQVGLNEWLQPEIYMCTCDNVLREVFICICGCWWKSGGSYCT